MNCKKCGYLLNENEKFCTNCGEPVDTMANQDMNQPMSNDFSQPTQSFNTPNMEQNNMQTPMQPQPEMNNNFNQGFNNQNFANPNMNQPMPNQNYNTPNQSTGGNNNFKTIVAVLIVVVLGIGGFIAYKAFSKDSNGGNTTPTNNVPDNPVQPVDNGDRYEYNGFQFVIPSGYNASDYQGALLLKGSKANVLIDIIDYYTLDDIRPYLNDLKQEYVEMGYNIKSVEEKTYGGKEWIVMPFTATSDGQTIEGNMTFTDLGEYHMVNALIVTTTDEVYTQLNNMFDTAKYNGSDSFAPSDEKEKFKANDFDKSAVALSE